MRDLPFDELQNWSSGRGFKKIYDHYAPFVWRVVLRTIGDENDAKAVTQNVFVVVYRGAKNFRFESAFSTWVYKITLNETIKFINKKKSRREIPLNDDIEIESAHDSLSDKDLTRKILSGLNAHERFLLVSREVDDIPFEELAIILGKSSGALRVELTRLKQKIREAFDEKL